MSYHIETMCIHGDEKQSQDNPYGCIATPIYQSATFIHPAIGESTGHNYTRESNPTRSELERVMKALEGAFDCVACNSGMSAIGLLMELFAPGDHIVASDDLYGGAVRLFDVRSTGRGISVTYTDTSVPEETEAAIQENTKALYIETPSNPTMKVTDIRTMRALADKYGLLLIVDNTLLTPYLQHPFALGADLVIHSGTKYLCGHNDTLGGFLLSKDKAMAEKIRYYYKTTGCGLPPFDSYMILRGIKTLAVRMERQQESALKIAGWLRENPRVTEVKYVGFPDHSGFHINASQAEGPGAMISFKTDTADTARRIIDKIRLFSYAESLGGTESLLTVPMIQTHADLPEEVREKLGITENFLRMSVGLEAADDLIEDLFQAFEE